MRSQLTEEGGIEQRHLVERGIGIYLPAHWDNAGWWAGGRLQMREGRGEHLPGVCMLPPLALSRMPCSRSAAPCALPCHHREVREGRSRGGM
jgi:hypothetical protein